MVGHLIFLLLTQILASTYVYCDCSKHDHILLWGRAQDELITCLSYSPGTLKNGEASQAVLALVLLGYRPSICNWQRVWSCAHRDPGRGSNGSYLQTRWLSVLCNVCSLGSQWLKQWSNRCDSSHQNQKALRGSVGLDQNVSRPEY